tara:strand:+ start:680 stop:799 length:120 start_codon:yes stop_codon:yes gene_type:complete
MNDYEQHLREWAKADPERLMPYVERALRTAEAKREQNVE